MMESGKLEIVKRQVEGILSDRQLIFKLTFEPLISPCERIPSLFPILTARLRTTQQIPPDHTPNKRAGDWRQ